MKSLNELTSNITDLPIFLARYQFYVNAYFLLASVSYQLDLINITK